MRVMAHDGRVMEKGVRVMGHEGRVMTDEGDGA